LGGEFGNLRRYRLRLPAHLRQQVRRAGAAAGGGVLSALLRTGIAGKRGERGDELKVHLSPIAGRERKAWPRTSNQKLPSKTRRPNRSSARSASACARSPARAIWKCRSPRSVPGSRA